jgi:hypothetical protein
MGVCWGVLRTIYTVHSDKMDVAEDAPVVQPTLGVAVVRSKCGNSALLSSSEVFVSGMSLPSVCVLVCLILFFPLHHTCAYQVYKNR